MVQRRSALSLVFAFAAAAVLPGCGGGDDGFFDVFQPRDATVADIEGRSFVFTDFQYGAVFDPSLDRTTTTLGFGPAVVAGAGHRLDFSLSARGAAASGTATLEGSTLILAFVATSPALPFTTTRALRFLLRADVDDGRISLTNLDTAIEQTSAPR